MVPKYTEAAYQALVQDIFHRFPSVQKEGFSAGAYKPGLERMQAFEAALGHPSRLFRSIHIAGTNGKGSVANMLASALSACGLRTGLFTSPHLIDFRERIVTSEGNTPEGANGMGWQNLPGIGHQLSLADSACPSHNLIPKEYVFAFLTEWMPWIEEHKLSFFEITTGLAFKWFAHQKVDVAVIETGLGGRLDSTNILEKPDMTVVTTIGFDHMALLGDTLPKIAAEKAGIFKPGVPALVGEWQEETAPVFEAAAPGRLTFADRVEPRLWDRRAEVLRKMDLQAAVQEKNLRTVLAAIDVLRPDYPALANDEALLQGIIHTARNMGFHGRWERLQEHPTVIADIGHNAHALRHNFAQLEARLRSGQNDALIIVYGIMADKDLDAILPLMPRSATYLFTTPDTPRALPAEQILRRYESARNTLPGACPPPDEYRGRGPSAQPMGGAGVTEMPGQAGHDGTESPGSVFLVDSVAGQDTECRGSAFLDRTATQMADIDDMPSQVTEKMQTCNATSADLRRKHLDLRPTTVPGRPQACATPSVAEAVKKALEMATPDTLIYIGGSTFVVAEALPLFGASA